MTKFLTTSNKRYGEIVLTRTKPLLASIQQVKTTPILHITNEEFLMNITEAVDRFIPIEHLIEFLEVARKESKARSAHPPALTVVGVLLEDVAPIRVHVGRAPTVDMKLFEATTSDKARAEVDADSSISTSLVNERAMACEGVLTAEAFASAVFAHADYMRAVRHVLEPKFFYDARHQNIMGLPAEEIAGSVKLDATRAYKLTLSPTKVNAETREVAAFLVDLEGTCGLFHPRDRQSRKIQLVDFADDTFRLVALCAALNINFSANVFLRLRAMPTEIRYLGEVEDVLDLEALVNEIQKVGTEMRLHLF